MFLTVHGTAGIALGTFTGNPILAFIMGVVSHFILDIVPHGDQFVDRWSRKGTRIQRLAFIFITEFSIALIFIFTMFNELIFANPYVLLAGMAGGMAPDFAAGFTTVFKSKLWNWYYQFHHHNHELLQKTISFKYGISLQLITLSLLTYQILST